MIDDPSNIVSTLKTEVGEDLRVVGEYSTDGYDLHYVRDDVRPRVGSLDVERIHNELVLQGLGKEYLEELFGAGALNCSVHQFDELTAWHFVRTESEGLYVSVDADAAVELHSFAERCKQYL